MSYISGLLTILLLALVPDARALLAIPQSVPPDDARLTVRHDVDHPAIFQPESFDKTAWQKRAAQLRTQALVAEGLWPLPPRTPLNAVVYGAIDRDAYTIEKVFFASYPGHYVSGNLYIPKNRPGKLPAVLCPHGHWPGGRFYQRTVPEARKQLDEGAETTLQAATYPIQARCAMLARMGCVVFQYDMVGYADSTAIAHRTGFTDVQAILRLQSFMGLQTWNTVRALDFIESLPDVDAKRIAVTGASGGATQTILIAACDDRPAVAFPAVMVSESMQGGCICENAPLLRIGTNNVELIASFAPKPLGMTAANDWTIALETDALPKIKTIYSLFGAGDDVIGKHFSFEHNYNQHSRELMYNWFDRQLKLGWPTPVKEVAFVPVPVGELSVYDKAHPRPADSADATTLRKYMTRASDQQLDELFSRDPAGYRQTVRAVLEVMIADQFPAPGQVVVSRSSGPIVEGAFTFETGSLGRRGMKEAVPFVSIIPHGWNGNVVVWADTKGKACLTNPWDKLSDDVRRLLDRKTAVISADLYLTGDFLAGPKPPVWSVDQGYAKQEYPGFFFAYNRSLPAERAHDLLTEIAFVRQWTSTREVDLIATGDVGPIALLARALAGDAMTRAAIDLNGFDFDRVKDADDSMLLPVVLKYGGIDGLAALCDPDQTLLAGAPKSGPRQRLADFHHLTNQHLPVDQLIDWVLKTR